MYCDSIKRKSKSNIITIFIFGSVQNYQNIMVWEGGGRIKQKLDIIKLAENIN